MSATVKLSPDRIFPFVVQSVNSLSPTVRILRLSPANGLPLDPLPVCYSVSLYDGEEREQRPYTPINLIRDYTQPLAHIDVLVRKYPGGALSSFLCSRAPGDAVSVRGPFVKLDIDEVVCRNARLGLIAGGTGITPMLQIIRYVLARCSSTAMTLLFGNTSDDEVLLREELMLHEEQSGGRLNVLMVTGPAITEEMIRSAMPPPDDQSSMIFLCGPPGMMRALGGGGRKEPLGGLLAVLGYTRVHKY